MMVGDSHSALGAPESSMVYLEKFCNGLNSVVNYGVSSSTAQDWEFKDPYQTCPRAGIGAVSPGDSICSIGHAFTEELQKVPSNTGFTHVMMTFGGNDFMNNLCSNSAEEMKTFVKNAITKVRTVGDSKNPNMIYILQTYCAPQSSLPIEQEGCTLSSFEKLIKGMRMAVEDIRTELGDDRVRFSNGIDRCGGDITTYSPGNMHIDTIHMNENGYCSQWSTPFIRNQLKCDPTIVWNCTSLTQSTVATQNGDPHLHFANGAIADFRGINDTVFNILSIPRFSFSMKTMDVPFLLPKPMKVDGSFFTNSYIVFKSSACDVLVKMDAEKPGFDITLGKSSSQKRYNKYSSFECDDFKIITKDISYEIIVKNTIIKVIRKPIYNSLSKLNWRFDTQIKTKYSSTKEVHGIIGQSFQMNKPVTNGKLDDYSVSNYLKTSAQAEGFLEGVYTDYIMKDIKSPYFTYSKFDEKEDKNTLRIEYMNAQSDEEKAFSDFEWELE